nr:Fe-Mn family superoxide dismutase [Paenibacillus roseus]
MPLRWLEEVQRWKEQEEGHARLIRKTVPDLEQEYVNLLKEWEAVFKATKECAEAWIKELLPAAEFIPPKAAEQVEELVKASLQQTREFASHLGIILKTSKAVHKNPVSRILIHHIKEESEKTLKELEGKTRSIWWETRSDKSGNTVPIGGHTLPPLPYAYDALEPYIDEETMRIHHDILHKNYVEGLNKAEKELQQSRKTGDFELVKHWERELAFNGAGHYLHTLFWDTLSPQGGGAAVGPIGNRIEHDFGSYDAFKKQFSQAAEKVEGGGWTILVWSPRSHRLEILQAEKHQNLSQWDVIPLLPIDVWEHSYYLKHQNKRADYIKDWWHVVNWPYVNERFLKASQLTWVPY